MLCPELAERVMYLKRNEKGVEEMCLIAEEIRKEGVEMGIGIGRKEGIGIGRKEGISIGRMNRDKEKIFELLKNGRTPEAIAEFCGYSMDLISEVQRGLVGAC